MGKLRKGQREHSALWNGISPDPASGTWGLIGAAAATKRHVPHRESSSRLNLDAGALRRTLKVSLRITTSADLIFGIRTPFACPYMALNGI